jgi:hypothetical protein
LSTDNTGLIACVTSQSKLQYSIPNATFKSDWDIVASIVQTVRASCIHITLEHVCGDQDGTTPTAELDLLAQLNAEADKYAGDFCFCQGEYCPIIPLMPTRSVSLNIDGKTVHQNFKTTIQEAIHGTALLEEMQVNFDWPDGTLEFIDWEAHRQSTQVQSHHCAHFVKSLPGSFTNRPTSMHLWHRPPRLLPVMQNSKRGLPPRSQVPSSV